MTFMVKQDVNTKMLIADELINMTQSIPFDKISINHLTATAHVSRNTFYYYFNDKYELVDWIFEIHINNTNTADKRGQNKVIDGQDIFTALCAHKKYYINIFNSSAMLLLHNKIDRLCTIYLQHIFPDLLGQRYISENKREILICYFAKASAYTIITCVHMGMNNEFMNFDSDFSNLNLDCLRDAIDRYSKMPEKKMNIL